MANELLPCPFCSGPAEIYNPFHMIGKPSQPATYRGGVRCRACGCESKATTPPDGAITTWNRRANAAPQASTVAGEARPVIHQHGFAAENQRLRTINESLDKQLEEVVTERDEYHDMADKLANAIADHLLVEIGEHSSGNCPWMLALEAIENAAPQASAEAFKDLVTHGMSIQRVAPADFLADRQQRADRSQVARNECDCATCRPHSVEMRMILCSICGDKRCPHAADHRNACTATQPEQGERDA